MEAGRRKLFLIFNRLLKNAHLLRFPHPSSLRRTAKYAWPTHQLVGVAESHSLFVVTPLSGFRGPCIWAFLSSPMKTGFSSKAAIF